MAIRDVPGITAMLRRANVRIVRLRRDNLVKGARNPRILDGRPGSVDMSNGITLKEVPPSGRGDRSQGDMHASAR